jgi:hypothetical protein
MVRKHEKGGVMADHDTERLLSAFADHLLRNRLADEKRGRYMVNWVRRFLAFPPPMREDVRGNR